MHTLTTWATTNTLTAAALTLAITAASVWATARAARGIRGALNGTPAAVVTAAIAAATCTAYTADTSWRFAAHYLDMGSTAERIGMFAAAELALLACALMARQSLRDHGTPGTPGMLVWAITGVQLIPPYAESGIIGGTVRAFVGPVLAALMWHLAMGIELRHTRPTALSGGLPATIARELRERLLSWLGLATRDRTAEQITRDRWTVRAVALAARLADTKPGTRRARRIARRLAIAVSHAQVGAEPDQRRMLLELLAARRHAAALATVALPSPWQHDTAPTAPDSAACTEPAITAATATTGDSHKAAPDTAEPDEHDTTDTAPTAHDTGSNDRTDSPDNDNTHHEEHPTPVTYDSPVDHAIRPLYNSGYRPTTSQMTTAMETAGLQPKGSTARQSRARIERREPHLATLPSALYRPTGS